MYQLVIFILLVIVIYYSYRNIENFTIVYPFYNAYHPYTNPFSECMEDVYGNMRCYDNVYDKGFLPYYFKYPEVYTNLYNRYRLI